MVRIAYGFAEPPDVSDERAKPHPDYPAGVPAPTDTSLLGFFNTDTGLLVVRDSGGRGYEIFRHLCGVCLACQTGDLWNCPERGAVVDVAGDQPELVLAYLDQFGTSTRRRVKSRTLGAR